jgi:6-pyruvoyltetrahydropterin/6-carboxytetrahydropterin synthase
MVLQHDVHELTRTVRLNIAPPQPGAETGTSRNTYAGFPTLIGLGIATSIDVTVVGEPDPNGGYVLDIKAIDGAVHRVAAPLLESAYRDAFAGRSTPQPDAIVAVLATRLRDALPRPLRRVRWHVTPFASWEIRMETSAAPTYALLRQKFDFAAAHRLHVPSMSAAENQAMFGKCNNPAGHGHNYQIMPCVRVPIGSGFRLDDLESIVTRVVLDVLDHKHLNEDVAAFDLSKGGVNPSVENIAKICFELLAPAILAHDQDAFLEHVTVWETDRTCSTFPA